MPVLVSLSRSAHYRWQIIAISLLLLFSILACNGTTPAEDNSMKLLSYWTIDTWMTPRPEKPVSLVIREKDGTRRLFLRYGGKENPIGEMERQFGEEIPVETQFVEIDGNRFLVFLVTDPVRSRARSIMIYRPDPNYPNHPELSGLAKSVVLDKHGMGVIPISSSEALDWSYLAKIIVTARNLDEGFLVEKVFHPPFAIDSRFLHLSLSN